jgi:hypothetical protein
LHAHPPSSTQIHLSTLIQAGEGIGAYVPYHTDAPIPEQQTDTPAEEPLEEDPLEENPFIAEGRTRQSTSSYRTRTRGVRKPFASRRDYINYHMQYRGNLRKHHPLLSYGKLTQKYLIHQSWLNFANEEDHQRKLQSTPQFRRALKPEFLAYHERNLRRLNANDPDVESQKIGRVFQMPSTARGSAKNTHMNITKAMAIRKAINPKSGLFITLTFNCKCPEMTEMIGTRANPADHPTLCCRLATQKFNEVLDMVSGPNGIFGPVKGWIWSLEYQKRGNKHWHLVIMHDPKMPLEADTPEFVDQFISAKIPERPEKDDPHYEAKKFYRVAQLFGHGFSACASRVLLEFREVIFRTQECSR